MAGALSAITSASAFVTRLLRAIAGVPDYERYVAHMHRAHPAMPVLTAREFHDQRLSARYERPGSRCC